MRISQIASRFWARWAGYWARRSGLDARGRLAARLASLASYDYKDAMALAHLSPRGFVAPTVTFPKEGFALGKFVFIDDRVTIYRSKTGGTITIGDHVGILRSSILEADEGGSIVIGDESWVHQDCKLIAALNDIRIGSGTLIAANCAMYPHNHGLAPGVPIHRQACSSKGSIIIGDNAWLGTGVIVLSGVRIGSGAAIGAGAVVSESIPDNAIAMGAPARVIRYR